MAAVEGAVVVTLVLTTHSAPSPRLYEVTVLFADFLVAIWAMVFS